MSTFIPPGPLRTPVLLTAFTRYDTALAVMEAIREAKPPRFYFACDGPRNEAEKVRTDRVRTLAEMVDWPCEFHTLFRDENKGSKYGMAANFDWFFAHEPEGIILEDDIRPALSFFWFAEELLERYRTDERVWAINGNNLSTMGEEKSPDGYWLSAHGYGAYWGWAGWKRSWDRFDIDMKQWPAVRDGDGFKDFFLSSGERAEAHELFERTWDLTIPTAWDYQFDFARIQARAMNIIPNVNLCQNIGFGDGGTHTLSSEDRRNQEFLHEARFPLQHPAELAIDPARDLAYFDAYVRTPLLRRIKSTVRAWIPGSMDKAITPFLSGLQRRLRRR